MQPDLVVIYHSSLFYLFSFYIVNYNDDTCDDDNPTFYLGWLFIH